MESKRQYILGQKGEPSTQDERKKVIYNPENLKLELVKEASPG